MINTNPPPSIVKTRTLSSPPIQTIPTNQYNISYLAQRHILHNILYLPYNITLKQLLQVILYKIEIFQYHQPPVLELIHNLHINHKFQQTLTIYKLFLIFKLSYNTSLYSTIHNHFKPYIHLVFYFYFRTNQII